jgi:iron complex outermembrane recepter protein
MNRRNIHGYLQAKMLEDTHGYCALCFRKKRAKTKIMCLFRPSILALILAALCPPLHAQNNLPVQQESPQPNLPDNQKAQTLEAVTVTGVRQKATATRQDAQLMDLPQSVTVIPETLIQDRGYTRIEEVANTVANLQPNTPYFGGISQGFYSRGFADTRVLVDGYKAGIDNVYNLVSAERIEVLRGPASVLYGQGNPGGEANLVLKRPLKEFGFGVEALIDSNGIRQTEVDWNQPLGSTVGIRVLGVLENSKSFRELVRTKNQYFSPAIRWTPGSDTTVDAIYQKAIYRSPYDEGFPYSTESSFALRTLPIERSYLEPWAPLRRTEVDSLRVEATHKLSDAWSLTGGYFETENKLVDAFGSIQLSGYDEATGTVQRSVRGEYPADQNRGKSRTLTLRTRGDITLAKMRHQLVAGVESSKNFYLYNVYQTDIEPIDLSNPAYGQATPTIATDFSFAGGGGARTTAAYVNDLVMLSEQFKLQLGLRFDRIVSEGYSDALFTLSDQTTYRRTTPSAGIVWQPDRNTSYYASATSSFVPLFGRNRLGTVLDPEIGKSFEVGFKKELLGGRAALTGAVFSIEKSGILQSDPQDPEFNINGGKARSRGFEVELQGKLTPATELIAGVGLADAKWVQSTDFPVGERLPGPSKVTAILSVKHTLQSELLPAGTWLSAALNYGSEREWIAPADPYKLPAYTRLDLGAAVPLGANIEVQFNIKNATDARITSANGFGIVIPEPPRTYALALRYRSGAL